MIRTSHTVVMDSVHIAKQHKHLTDEYYITLKLGIAKIEHNHPQYGSKSVIYNKQLFNILTKYKEEFLIYKLDLYGHYQSTDYAIKNRLKLCYDIDGSQIDKRWFKYNPEIETNLTDVIIFSTNKQLITKLKLIIL